VTFFYTPQLIEFIDHGGKTLESNNSPIKVWGAFEGFLEYCRTGKSADLEKIVLGVADVLSGKLTIFQSEYKIFQESPYERCVKLLVIPSVHGGAVLVHEDITNHRLLENEGLGISEIEQKRICKILHDGLCQILSGMTLSIAVLADSLKERDAPETKEIEYLFSIAQSAADETRNLYHRIFPLDESSNALSIALQHLTNRIGQSISCSFFCSTDIPIKNRNISLLLYRITQEVCHEAENFSQAQNITLRLVEKLGKVVLDIEDDGHTAVSCSEQFSEQLKNFYHRVSLLAGRIHIKRDSARGSRLRCIVPLNPSHNF